MASTLGLYDRNLFVSPLLLEISMPNYNSYAQSP